MNRFLAGVAGSLLFRVPFWIIAWWTLPTLCNWDCGIYAGLVRGYTVSHAAFFPLFPLLVGWIARILPFLSPEASVVLTSNLFVPIAGALFLIFVDGLWADASGVDGLWADASGADGPRRDELRSERTSTRAGAWQKRIAGFQRRSWLALLLLSVFPEGHFWMRGYSEPVFFTFLMAILLCVRLLSVRLLGVWVAGIVGTYLLWQLLIRRRKQQRMALAGSALLCALPFLVFMGWLWKQTGNPLYFYAAQHDWGRKFEFLAGLKAQLPHWDASHLYLYLGLWAGIRFLRRPSLDWRLLGALSLALTELPVLFGGFYSYVRFSSVNPALFILSSELILATSGATRRTASGATDGATGWAAEGTALAVVVWCVIRLAIQVHQAGSGWVG